MRETKQWNVDASELGSVQARDEFRGRVVDLKRQILQGRGLCRSWLRITWGILDEDGVDFFVGNVEAAELIFAQKC